MNYLFSNKGLAYEACPATDLAKRTRPTFAEVKQDVEALVNDYELGLINTTSAFLKGLVCEGR